MNLEDLVAQADIVEYISQYADLQQRGDEWWCLSLFKEERTPSFSVRQDPPFFCDYSSGKSGNILTFIREYDRCSGKEAVAKLKKFVGYNGELDKPAPRMAATETCLKFKPPKPIPKKSGGVVLSDDIMKQYESRPEKLEIWKKEGMTNETFEKFQVKYDSFANRIVYPIYNTDGKIVNIGGRTLAEDYKEKGIRKYTYYYNWSALNIIYGMYENMDEIMSQKEIILFEGCKSVLIADSLGIHNTGAILTSHLNKSQAELLIRSGVQNVTFALDNDIKIWEDKNINALKRYINVYYLHDQDGFLSEKDSPIDKGREVFQKLYDKKIKLR